MLTNLVTTLAKLGGALNFYSDRLTGGFIIAIIIVAVIFLIFFFSFVPIGLAISARASGVRVGLFQLVGMRIRKVKPARIV